MCLASGGTGFPTTMQYIAFPVRGDETNFYGFPVNQSEPSIAIDPSNAKHVVIAAKTDIVASGLGLYYSTNGGASVYTVQSDPFLPGYSDPSVAFDRSGAAYVAYLLFCPGGGQSVGVSRSDDNDLSSWPDDVQHRSKICTPISTDPYDKTWLAIGPNPNDATHDIVYVLWNAGGNYHKIYCAYSTDRGQSFSSPPLQINPTETVDGQPDVSFSGSGVMPAVGPAGVLYVTWGVFVNALENNDPMDPNVSRQSQDASHDQAIAHLAFCKSADGGQSFTNPKRLTDVKQIGSNCSDDQYCLQSSVDGDLPIKANCFPSMSVDQSTGAFYVVWGSDEGKTKHTDNPVNADIYLGYSTDGGDHFLQETTDNGSTWHSINSTRITSDVEDEWMPSVAVSPSDHGVNVVFYSRQSNTSNKPTELLLARSTDGGNSFGASEQLSQSTFDMRPVSSISGSYSNGYTGDYIGLAAAGNFVIPVWMETAPTMQQTDPRYSQLWTVYHPVTTNVGNDPGATVTLDNVDVNGHTLGGTIGRWSNLDGTFYPQDVGEQFSQLNYIACNASEVVTSGGLKFNKWIGGYTGSGYTSYINPISEDLYSGFDYTFVAYFKQTYNHAILQDRFLDHSSIVGGTIAFADPWLNEYYDPVFDVYRNLGSSPSFHTFNSPFDLSTYHGSVPYTGFFLNEQGPFYSVRASQLLNPDLSPKTGPIQQGDWFLAGISGDNATPTAIDGSTAKIVFGQDYATVKANYKQHLATGNGSGNSNAIQANGLPSNSQRAVVSCQIYNPDNQITARFSAMVYVDNSMLLFTWSNDGGLTWAREMRVDGNWEDPGYVVSASLSIRSDMHVGIVWEDRSGVVNGGDLEPLLHLQEMVPTIGIPAGGTVPVATGFAALKNLTSTLLMDGHDDVLYGSKPIVAPYAAKYTTDAHQATDFHWWVGWLHSQQATDQGSAMSAQIQPGIYVAIADNQNSLHLIYDNANLLAPNNCVPGSFVNGAIGDNPTASASFIDAPFPPQGAGNSGNSGNTTQALPDRAKGMLNSAEGSRLHISWDINGSIYYANIPSIPPQGATIYPMANAFGAPAELTSKWSLSRTMVNTFQGTQLWGNLSSINWFSRPSLAVDNYDTNASPGDPYEEPLLAWEFQGAQLFVGPITYSPRPGTNLFALSYYGFGVNGVMTNRRGRSAGIGNNPPWANKFDPRQYPQIFIVNSADYSRLDHPSVVCFPMDNKALMGNLPLRNDLHGALSFHAFFGNLQPPFGGDQTVVAYSYFSQNGIVPLSVWNTSVPSCGCTAGTQYSPWTSRGTIEPHLSYGKYGITPFYGGQRSTDPNWIGKSVSVLYKEVQDNGSSLHDAANVSVPMFNYGVPSSHLGFAKQGTAFSTITTLPGNYLGTSVQVDTIGSTALLLGEVIKYGAQDSTIVPMRETVLDSTDSIESPPHDLSRTIRSRAFTLSTGDAVSAAVYILSDSTNMIRLMNSGAIVSYSVAVVDSSNGNIKLPMYQINIGGHSPHVMLPDSFPYFTYYGPPVARAYVRIRLIVNGVPDSVVAMSGISVHSLPQEGSTGFAKQSLHSAGRFGPVSDDLGSLALEVFPNPVKNSPYKGMVSYVLPVSDADDIVDVKVYDMAVNDVSHLFHGFQSVGRHQIELDGSRLPSGRYVVAVHTSNHQQSKLLIMAH